MLALPVAFRLKLYTPKVATSPLSKPVSIALTLEKIRPYLPSGIELYEIGGQTVFPVYGASGGLCTSYAAYFCDIKRSLASSMEFRYNDTADEVKREIATALKNFETVDFNGGALPRRRRFTNA